MIHCGKPKVSCAARVRLDVGAARQQAPFSLIPPRTARAGLRRVVRRVFPRWYGSNLRATADKMIVVSGLLRSQGNPAQVLALVLSSEVSLCHDERILAEYAEVLARPRFLVIKI